jgi:hypothetical protein
LPLWVILGGILNNEKLVGLWSVACVAWSVGLWLSYVFIWLVPIQVKNERDKVLSYYYMAHAKALLQLPLLEPSTEGDVLVREIEVNDPRTNPAGTFGHGHCVIILWPSTPSRPPFFCLL